MLKPKGKELTKSAETTLFVNANFVTRMLETILRGILYQILQYMSLMSMMWGIAKNCKGVYNFEKSSIIVTMWCQDVMLGC